MIRPTASLKKLKAGGKMPAECLEQLVETILSPSSLEKMEFWHTYWTLGSARKFEILENNSNLAKLHFVDDHSGLDVVVPFVAKALHKNKSLKTLKIPSSCGHDYEIPCDSIIALSEMLKVIRR